MQFLRNFRTIITATPISMNHSTSRFRQIPRRLLLASIVTLLFNPESILCKTDTTESRSPAIRKNDIFKANVELPDIRNHGEFSIYITSTTRNPDTVNEYDIEAIAVISVNNACSFYGLKGQYDESWKQLNLYNTNDASPQPTENDPVSRNTIPGFEPIGLAGRLSDDDKNLHCYIDYNGNAILHRVGKSKNPEHDLYTRISECSQVR